MKEPDIFEDPLTNIENLKQFAPHSGDQCILRDKENPKSEQLAIVYKLCMHLHLFYKRPSSSILTMSARAISEVSNKRLLNCQMEANCGATLCRFTSVSPETDWDKLAAENAWLKSEKLLVHLDQLMKRRGKLGLTKVNANFQEVKESVIQGMGKDQQIEKATGKL